MKMWRVGPHMAPLNSVFAGKGLQEAVAAAVAKQGLPILFYSGKIEKRDFQFPLYITS